MKIKKVDSQGRLVLPSDWREAHLGDRGEVLVLDRGEYLKIIPRGPVDLTEGFDKVELDVDSIGDWSKFERDLPGDARQ